jgi:RHH-type transcriptional regulator, proline utilization regulon repressor / proline dehydrogenase / delta 1-pyrroline-5-carboxylate dehydrogenase
MKQEGTVVLATEPTSLAAHEFLSQVWRVQARCLAAEPISLAAHDGEPARDLEALTQDFGREIFARLGDQKPLLFTPSWWDERLLQWTMGEEAIKVQLFRFIDALPLLSSHRDINCHLREYFSEAGPLLPGWVRLSVRFMPTDGIVGRFVAKTARRSAERLAHRFIAGSDLTEALSAIAALRRRSLAFTVDLLGEATITELEAERYENEYLQLLDGLSREVNAWPAIDLIDRDSQSRLPRVNVSIKLSSLYSQFDSIDPDGTSTALRQRLRPILRQAQRTGSFINFDMEQFAFKDTTLRIFREILEEQEFRHWKDVGIALQAYLRDCFRDLQELHSWVQKRGTPVWVRLVKGAYWDYETIVAAQEGWPVPVFSEKWQSDANYEQCTQFLLQHCGDLRPVFGTHNVRSLAFALAAAKSLGLPKDSYEIQMLYGMAEPIKDALVSMGHRVRVYTPYGQMLPGMAYLVRRLLENTANESFLRASFVEHISEERLLMHPVVKGQNAVGNGKADESGGSPAVFRNEPLADFSREEARQAMRRALDEVRSQFAETYPLVIGNSPRSTAEIIDSINPSRIGEVVGRCGRATVTQAEEAIAAARSAFPAWSATDPQRRAAYFHQAAKVMRRRRFELAAWEVYECGKQWREADADVAEAIDYCNYYAEEMLRLAQPQRRDVPGEENAYFYHPRGVAIVIAPWNFPLAILCGMTVAALVTGNTAVMKPAEQSSVIGAKLMEVFQEVGLPAGVVNYLSGIGEEVGPTLTNHPEVALIAFTGSKNVGLLLNRQAAETPPGQSHVKRIIAEMGGKNAIIVDDDADLDEAVHGVVASAFGYQGQKCSACSRAIVLDSLYDVFLSRLVQAARSLKIGPADDPGCFVGPVIDEEARQRIHRAIEQGKKEARLAYAADIGPLAQEGCYVGPHVFVDVPPDSSLAQDEIFGPVLSVIRARDFDHALQIANGTAYALTGGIYSRSPHNLARAKREFLVGNLYINRRITGALVDRQPFGGFKLSGMGSKAGGPDYLLQFLLPRTITENTMRRGFAPVDKSEEHASFQP